MRRLGFLALLVGAGAAVKAAAAAKAAGPDLTATPAPAGTLTNPRIVTNYQVSGGYFSEEYANAAYVWVVSSGDVVAGPRNRFRATPGESYRYGETVYLRTARAVTNRQPRDGRRCHPLGVVIAVEYEGMPK